jgi:nanoRNase/pAp phosphatase (c-di-AMP/oligoRNAs hydrolase)
MAQTFSKSVSHTEKYKKLLELVSPEDTLAVLINADPDAIASALALKRLLWRRLKRVLIYRINTITRADNLSMVKLLKIDLRHIRSMDSIEMSKWALLDSQPHHEEQFRKYPFDIIIDHHPLGSHVEAPFLDVQEDYGANSTILTEYIRAAKIRPSPRLATALFYGIKTDTDNFVRPSAPNDINAFRYLYQFANINIIKKIESSEMTKKTLSDFKKAMDNLIFYKDIAFTHMGKVNGPDVLVMIADFFLKMAETTWSIVSGICGQKLIVIIRNAGFRRDAGKMAKKLFGLWGTAGGHKSAARAEIPLNNVVQDGREVSDMGAFVLRRIKKL